MSGEAISGYVTVHVLRITENVISGACLFVIISGSLRFFLFVATMDLIYKYDTTNILFPRVL